MEPVLSPADAALSVRVLAPAKVNLGLRVIGVRPDGYHRLESVFVPLDWSDTVHLTCSSQSQRRVHLVNRQVSKGVSSRLLTVPEGDENLAHRAAMGFLQRADLSASVQIELTKEIPAAAGLGGGSSDAGAVLRGLAKIWPEALPETEMRALALSLGADVPFFLDPRPALVSGIGEKIEPLERFPAFSLLLANPGEALSTAKVFKAWDVLAPSLTPARSGSTLRALSAFLEVEPTESGLGLAAGLQGLLVNDLEASAKRLCPSVGRLLASLKESGAKAVSMSGSGATVFGVFDSSESARGAQKNLDLGESGWSWLAASQSAR